MLLRTTILAIALLTSGYLSAKVTEEESYSFELSEGGRLSVSNVNGSITVTGGSGDSVEIVAIKTADNQKALDGIEIEITNTADSIEIETDLPNSSRWFGGGNNGASVTYEIKVPASTNLDSVETVNGHVEVGGVLGDVQAESVNGSLDLSGLAANASLSTVNGSIDASFSRLEGQQKVKAETVNGRVTIRIPKDSDVDISADTLNGGINARDFGLETKKGFVGSDLNGSIGSGSARLNIDTVSGSIKIRSN
ncbi:MAG: DUF4097 family beta strand repeat-containing protein [Xanthomonadales bacterium]